MCVYSFTQLLSGRFDELDVFATLSLDPRDVTADAVAPRPTWRCVATTPVRAAAATRSATKRQLRVGELVVEEERRVDGDTLYVRFRDAAAGGEARWVHSSGGGSVFLCPSTPAPSPFAQVSCYLPLHFTRFMLTI